MSIGEVGGDRCNGGISIQDSNNNSFTVSKNLTPVDLINVTQMGKKLKIEPYEDLESSAMSCVGTKKTQYFVKNSKINFKLLGYDLSEEPNDDPDWVKRYKYQECFNKELKKMKGHLANQLATQKALENFVSQFSSSCIKK